jgi:hypothetical protein
VHVAAVGVRLVLGVAGRGAGGPVAHRDAVAVGVVGKRLGARVGAAVLLLLGDQVGHALVGEGGGAVLAVADVVFNLGAGAVQRVIGVAGVVSAGGAVVHVGGGQPLQVVVGVVSDQIGRGAARGR